MDIEKNLTLISFALKIKSNIEEEKK